jgi:hypothetical protein
LGGFPLIDSLGGWTENLSVSYLCRGTLGGVVVHAAQLSHLWPAVIEKRWGRIALTGWRIDHGIDLDPVAAAEI